MMTIQNAYSLINRVFEGNMEEVSLRENIGSIDLTLNDEVLEQINAVHNVMPNPAS